MVSQPHVTAELIPEVTTVDPGQPFDVALHLHSDPGWHTYWVNPGDTGTPIHLFFKVSHGVKVQKVLFPIPERQQTGPLIAFGYSHLLLLPIELKLDQDLAVGRPVSSPTAPRRPGWPRRWPAHWRGFSAAVLSGSDRQWVRP